MKSVSITELRQRLAHYLDRVEQGERIQITRRGRVVATFEPVIAADMTASKRLEVIRRHARIGDVVSPIEVDWKTVGSSS